MDEEKRKRLEAAGWEIGSAYDFLEMTDEEASYVELKLALNAVVRDLADLISEPRPALRALVGLIDEPLDVDAYLENSRGPAWDAELDGASGANS